MAEKHCLSRSCTEPNEALVSNGQQSIINIISKIKAKEDVLYFELEKQFSVPQIEYPLGGNSKKGRHV